MEQRVHDPGATCRPFERLIALKCGFLTKKLCFKFFVFYFAFVFLVGVFLHRYHADGWLFDVRKQGAR